MTEEQVLQKSYEHCDVVKGIMVGLSVCIPFWVLVLFIILA